MNWFYATKDKTQAGPVDDATLDGLFQSGTISAETLVWAEGMENWKPYSQARTLATVPEFAGNDAVCAECGQTFPKNSMIQQGNAWVCASCKPVFLQKLAEGAIVNTGGMRYAGFWIRFVAKFIDGLILGVVIMVPMMVIIGAMGGFSNPEEPSGALVAVQLALQLFSWVVSAAFSIFFIGKYGATPGKMACKIHGVDASGAKIGYGRATGRFFAEILSGLICYIGYIMAGFDVEKRALHDRLCNTRVVYK